MSTSSIKRKREGEDDESLSLPSFITHLYCVLYAPCKKNNIYPSDLGVALFLTDTEACCALRKCVFYLHNNILDRCGKRYTPFHF